MSLACANAPEPSLHKILYSPLFIGFIGFEFVEALDRALSILLSHLMAPRPGLEPGTYGLTAGDPGNILSSFKRLRLLKLGALKSALKILPQNQDIFIYS